MKQHALQPARLVDGEPSTAPAAKCDSTLADAAMERYAVGDDAAFAVVYDALAYRIFGYLRRNLGSVARAEDVVQQTFLHMHRARGTFVAGSRVSPWAFAIARRLLIDELRRDRRNLLTTARGIADEAKLASSVANADDLLEADDLARRVAKRLAAIPETQRTAFELVRVEGFSHAEAAEMLGMTVNAVKLRAHRAYVALRDLLDADAG